jgi:hypothetical protein
MKLPTLYEFLEKTKKAEHGRSHVDEPKFESLYVRYGNRYVITQNESKIYLGTLDIANVTVEDNYRGSGVFTALIKRLRNDYPDLPVYIENPLEERFQNHLESIGLQRVQYDCFFLGPGKMVNTKK